MLASVLYELFRELAFRLLFLSCVYWFRFRLLFIFCVALGSVLLILGFHSGCVRSALRLHLGFAWVMPPRTIIYLLPKLLILTYGKRGLGNRPGREVGDRLFASWRKTPFRITLCIAF